MSLDWLGSVVVQSSRRLGDWYAEIFDANDIDSRALRELGSDVLKELGVSLGHRKVLLRAIAELNGNGTATERGGVAHSDTARSASEVAPLIAIVQTDERRQLTVLFCDMMGFRIGQP